MNSLSLQRKKYNKYNMKIDLANIREEWDNKQGWVYAFY